MSAAPPVRFAGYAAVFDKLDRGGDVIRRGAFTDMPERVPLLWQHRGAPIGTIERIATDARGLRVIGRVEDPRLAALLRDGGLSGLSIGYRTLAARTGRIRELTRLDLVEVSLVAQPMQPAARVHLVEGPAMGRAPDLVPPSGRPRADEEHDHG